MRASQMFNRVGAVLDRRKTMTRNRTLVLLCGSLLAFALVFQLPSSAKTAQGPFNLVASDSGRYVQLNWDADFSMTIQGYNIYRSVKGPDSWEKLNEKAFPLTTFVDYSAPRSELVFYRVNFVDENSEESPSAAVVGISTSAAVPLAKAEAALAYDKNDIITDSQLINAGAMSAAQIQNFLASQSSVLANYFAGGKTAAQRIHDDCQTHGISPYVVLVTLQKEKGLIRSSTANPNSFAMGWNTGDSSTSDFANQIYYGTRQFKLHYENVRGYHDLDGVAWYGQTRTVNDGRVTGKSTATEALYMYTPWIGQGGGGRSGVGGNYLFWDLWKISFRFETTTASAISDGFDYPISNVYRPTRTRGDSDGWYVSNSFGNNLASPPCSAHYHPGDDWNKDNGQDADEPVKAASNGTIVSIRSLTNSAGTFLGQGIGISHVLPDGSTVYSVYVHVNVSSSMFVGKSVMRGDPVATIYNLSSGPHLHFEMRTSFNVTDWYPGDDGCGYYYTYDAIISRGFIDPVAFIDSHRSFACQYSVGQGASGAEVTAFQNAFDIAGGQDVLGCATAAVRFDGFISFANTVGHYQTFANGDIEYHSNGSRAGQAYALIGAFSTKWASLGYTSNNPLGYPIGNRTAGTPSCAGTSHEFQTFEGGSLTHHLNGARSGSVYEVHGAIHSKWSLKGFASCPLGLPTSDERAASPSPVSGRTGRVGDFERGHIHWWTGAAQAYETHGSIDSLYTSMGGTTSWLGFPTSDEYLATTGYARSDFEGGYITTLNGVNYQAFPYNCNAPGTFSLISPNNGQVLNQTSVTLSWGVSANANSYDVYFGTTSNPPFLANQAGTSRTVSVTSGQTYFWKVVAKVSCNSSLTSATPISSFTIQTSCAPAQMTSPANRSTFTSSTVAFNWTTGTCVTRYWIFIGSTPGAYDLFNRDMVTSTSVTTTMPTDGRTVYVTLWSWINGAWQSNAYSYIAGGCAKAAMTSPANGSTFPSSTVTFNWTTGSCVTRYWIFIGSTPGAYDLFNRDMVTTRSVTATMPTDGRTIYVTLWSWINGAWQSNSYTYTAHLLGGCSPLKAAMTSPANGSTFTSSTVTFNWTTGSCVTRYWIFIGSTPGAYDLFNRDMVTSTSVTTTMPTNGRTVYVTLWSWINGAWQSNVYTYTAQTSGATNTPFQIRDHVNESAFGSFKVDFVGNR
jgi:murein DD-endopeptidase MepM/ murein hydrolase activator NlpD